MWQVLEKFSKKKVPLTMLFFRTFSLTKWRIWQRIFATKKSTQIGVRSQAMVWGHSTYIAEKRRKRKQHESPLVFTSNKQTNVTPDISKYSSVGSDSTLTKWIIFYFIFQKMEMNSFLKNMKLYFFSIIYYKYCDMGSEIIQHVAYDNYDNSQHVNFIFS
jgi:hypothetical protein